MIEEYLGEAGREKRIAELARQTLLGGNHSLATALEKAASFEMVHAGEFLIEQGTWGRDVFFIIAGEFEVIVNGHRRYGARGPGAHVGEMAALERRQARSADIVALTDSVVAKVSGDDFIRLLDSEFELYKPVALTLCERLNARNEYDAERRTRTRVFLISASEGKDIADRIVAYFEDWDFEIVPWYAEGFFPPSGFTLPTLEKALPDFDHAIAVATTDDITISRDKKQRSMRDNVLFEAGLFMGRLGRERVVIIEPEHVQDEGGEQIDKKTPSDFFGMHTVRVDEKNLEQKLKGIGHQIVNAGPFV